MNKLFGRGARYFGQQLAIAYGAAVLAVAIISSLAVSWIAARDNYQNSVQQGHYITQHLASLSRLALLYESADNVRDAVNATMRFPTIQGIAIYTRAGRVLVQSGTIVPSADFAASADMSAPGESSVRENSALWRFYAPVFSRVRVSDADGALDAAMPELLGFVEVNISKAGLNSLVSGIFLGNLGLALAVATLLLIGLHIFTRRLLRPLRNLAETMSLASDGSRALRVTLDGPKDFLEMGASFNHMMESLENREHELNEAKTIAETMAASKLQFLANISHEIRTPLHGILGTLGLTLNTSLSPLQRQYLEVATSSSDNLLGLLDDLLDLSKAEGGKLSLENTRIDVLSIAEDSMALQAERAQQKGIEIVLLYEGDFHLPLLGDPNRIAQIFNNLLSNAVKFTNRGEVVASLKLVPQASGYELLAEIKDTGIGIPHRAQHKIFEAFSQADASTSRRFGGTGLGLSLTRQLVEAMGGRIGLDSVEGVGSTFWVRIPLALAGGAPVAGEETPDQFIGVTVLLVESHPLLRRNVRQYVEAAGISAVDASDLNDAVRAYQVRVAAGQRIDLLIVSDTVVQAENAGVLEGLVEQARCPIIRLTALSAIASEKRSVARGVVFKPLRRAQLLDAIAAALGGRNAASASTGVSPAADENPDHFSGYSVLVVEDNEINQMVARGMLEQLCLDVTVVANGYEAVIKSAQRRFDLIFMDCRMPVMDGYMATQEIRVREGDGRRTPIIAMSANVTVDEQSRARASGMDGFIPKPFSATDLRVTLSRWLPQLTSYKAVVAAPNAIDGDHPIDMRVLDDLRDAVAGPIDKIISAFLTQLPGRVNQLKHYGKIGDNKAMAWVAHSLKGSCGNIGARKLAEMCAMLEMLGTNGASVTDEVFASLDAECTRVSEALARELDYA